MKKMNLSSLVITGAVILTAIKRSQRHDKIKHLAIAAILLLLPIFLCSCATTTVNYRSAEPECLEYAIACCRSAIVDDGLEAGLINYIPEWGDGSAHCVVWIKDVNGVERIYDPAFRKYRTLGKGDLILHKGEGLDLGIYGRLLKPMKIELAGNL